MINCNLKLAISESIIGDGNCVIASLLLAHYTLLTDKPPAVAIKQFSLLKDQQLASMMIDDDWL